MNIKVLNKIQAQKVEQKKGFAVLIDPDEYKQGNLANIVEKAHVGKVDYFFVGGSLVMGTEIEDCIQELKSLTDIPVLLFPGSIHQVTPSADALLFLSLLSSRNADLLIGKHVEIAPILAKMDLEVLPTAYMLVDGLQQTTVSYISNSNPIPADKPKIAQATALAGQMLGFKLLYLDSGSGAKQKVSNEMLKAVSSCTHLPIIVGGGIKTPEAAAQSCIAGADIVVVGNAIENDSELIIDIAQAIHSLNKVTSY